jgi:hypothetical protein
MMEYIINLRIIDVFQVTVAQGIIDTGDYPDVYGSSPGGTQQ